ncbi:hypothetical protein PanWU01x14_171500 [Parasponia andersonii]|uniref:Uncharacterized protein n=1 Tax=Parasponia andersonii TaxID=3476 RepID=A0A2P5C9R0_PARAD|nr:hypothetical protein PanWU01x14_171500 [Parasponia andersonii]
MEWDFIDEDNDFDMVQRVWEQSCITLPLVLVPNPRFGWAKIKGIGLQAGPEVSKQPKPTPGRRIRIRETATFNCGDASILILCARLLLFPEASLALSDHVGPACKGNTAAAVTTVAKYFSA